MATTPQINLPDGTGTTTDLRVTTNLFGLFFTGTVDSNTVDVQIDVNGAGYVSNPSLVELSLPDFSVPNPSAYPEGIQLEQGINVIRLRAIDISGDFSPPATITVEVIPDSVDAVQYGPPTGVKVQRDATSVTVEWSDQGSEDATGYNVYASTGPGGTGSGYLRVNLDMIPADSPMETQEEEFEVASVSHDLDNPSPGAIDAATAADLLVEARTVGAVSNQVLAEVGRNRFPLAIDPKYRLRLSVSAVRQVKRFAYPHDRNRGIVDGYLNSDTFSAVSADEPLYYVVTAVYFDQSTGSLRESRFSQELVAAPLPLDTTIRGIRIREQSVVARDYIKDVNEIEPELSLIPGSTVREIHIEPFANEAEKAYFLMDFVHRSKSFAALLQIDDPNLTGTSIPVSSSYYKQNLKTALSLSSDVAVQNLIDSAFDSLAANFNVPRQGRRPAVVNQTFFTTTRPTRDLVVTQDAVVQSSTNPAAPRFRANGSITMVAANAQAYFNPDKRRYEVSIQMIADVPGAFGNLPAGALDTVVSGADGLQTENVGASDFGHDRQSNLELSVTAMRVLSSLDSGTEGGYIATANSVPGLLECRVVKSGDPDMMRDYDPVRGKHVGGKVDIWCKGTVERTVVNTFAFQFSIARNVRFDVIDPLTFTFRARDSRLTPDNPISEVLFNPSQGLGLRNHSNVPTTPYDLIGVEIVDYRTIRLSSAVPQPPTSLDDFVEGDYRFRSNNRFVATFQPVRRVSSVVGDISGPIDPGDGFTLFKTQDPLLEGESTIAQDYVEIHQVDGVPSGDSVLVNAETHVMIGEFPEPLNSVGINVFTLRVFSDDRTVEYRGPSLPDPDYLILDGTQTTPIKLVRTALSDIPNGATVSVDYEHDENFAVTYVVNDVLQQVQQKVNAKRHVTADVLAKQAVENPYVAEMTVQLLSNAEQAPTDAAIRTNLSVLSDNRGVGGSVRISDGVAAVDNASGVDFVVQPFTRFTLQDGAVRIRDSVQSAYVFLPSLSLSSNAVYLLDDPLPYDTTDGGGPANVHHGVFMDELQMASASSLEDVGSGLHRSWIIGRLGAVIPGYSDDATLLPVVVDPADIPAERVRRTANRVVVSLDAGVVPADVPTNHSFAASYVVEGDQGTKDLETTQVEYLVPGSVTVTYRRP